MECVSCGLLAGYNRVVVDLVSGRELGGFCRNCELDEFGQTLSKLTQPDSSCVLCRRDGHFGLAAWTPYRQESNARVICDVEFEVRERTPLLCDEHYYDACAESEGTVCRPRGSQP